MADSTCETWQLTRAPRLYIMANLRDLHIHHIIFQFKDALAGEDEHYQSVLLPLEQPHQCTSVLHYFHDDQPQLEALCQCYYAKRITTSMARMMRTNRLRGIYTSGSPFVVNVLIEQHEGTTDFIPICHARASPRSVKVTSRGDRTRHITIRLLYSGESAQIHGINSIRHRYRQLLGSLGNLAQAWNRLKVATFPLGFDANAEYVSGQQASPIAHRMPDARQEPPRLEPATQNTNEES